ncbi:2-haloacid dehalogenase [Roseovarius nanhaiticus]|uniref:2-haloacid dehalogenase n=1 Tax=Roseovarius nanhaiticus TaxID=573024 RepID=A0A1N7FD90_9RHOB|nr:HAD family phosphatase [Roseovarius nanhaiticus]SEK57094.1 2-haloacid dehalogenase [Roseovarius nanhaiticus]SIR98299.1 2-haloacid dehalogenase [Roseovarius nanhaiticus]
MTPQAVIFDIGNVLIAWQPERYFDRLCGASRRRAMFGSVDIHAMMNRIDAGADFGAEAARMAAVHPDFASELMHFRDHWCDIAQPAIPHSVRLMTALRARGVPVYALSNFGAGNFPLSAAQFPFLRQFDRAYISGRMGLIKPDPAIYAAVEADCGLLPEALFFTDDRAENIEAAAARGWQVHLFEQPEGLARALVTKGLLTPQEAT